MNTVNRILKGEPRDLCFLAFAASVFTKGERPTPGRGEAAFWLSLLSLYSGARRSELAGLRANDVQDVEHVPCFIFIEDKKIGKKLKTATAVDTVPIHPQLITLGWLQHVDAIRRRDGATARLFPACARRICCRDCNDCWWKTLG
jgi:integrase